MQGLTPEEVKTSREKYGANVLTPPPRTPWWKLYGEKFADPVIRILSIAACIALGAGVVEGAYWEGIGIVISIFLSTFMSFLNEYKAGKEFDILNLTSDDIPVKVRRNGDFITIPKKEVVVGDVVWIELGDEVPADGVLLEAISLQVDESRLTGETEPADKFIPTDSTPPGQKTYPPDKLYRGTNIVNGRGMLEITAVGDSSEIGKTALEAAKEPEIQTPLQKQLLGLSKFIGVIAFSTAALIFIILTGRGFLSGEIYLTSQQTIFLTILIISVFIALAHTWLPVFYDLQEISGREKVAKELPHWSKFLLAALGFFAVASGGAWALKLLPPLSGAWLPAAVGFELLRYFMVAVTIIVASIPEGLPMSVTLSLAYSMRKMTASNNLVRHMHACETIGAATVICTDKTGTLTTNEMRVFETNFPGLKDKISDLIYENIAANTTANISKASEQEIKAIGNPTECALLIWLHSQGADYEPYRHNFKVTEQWTFSTERKFMATMGQSAVKPSQLLHLKGAPEIILQRCQNIITAQGIEAIGNHQQNIQEAIKSYQGRGMRTLAFACKEITAKDTAPEISDLAQGMTWLGFAAIIDPIREEVPPAIQMCRQAGIEVKIVTGDNQETATEIARQIGLWTDGDPHQKHLTGNEFEALSDDELRIVINSLKILSRARPAHKLRLVKTLQAVGQVVAVTGDGTNDAPALNNADVGLSMGKAGTAVAKEASDIILLDDSFKSIENAVVWGRSIYENIQRFILFQLTINVVALGSAVIGPFIGVKLPLTVTQILWVNLIMDTFAALALAGEPPHEDVMKKKPRNPADFIISRGMAKNIIVSAGLFLTGLLSFLIYIQRDGQVTDYELSVFFSGFVLLQFWNLFNARALGWRKSAFSNLTQNRSFIFIALVILLGQILLVQFAGNFFRTIPLSLTDWLLLIGGTSIVLWAGEILRMVKRNVSIDN
ncbi:MAG: calcium-translocating P-type ATPase, PMCA-type [Candidatus Schekmanbacteria bacterium]|nr:calcium-translocating P-type ATPase, PMCA-type [Candidatus Schekmanbacteria bacterium]